MIGTAKGMARFLALGLVSWRLLGYFLWRQIIDKEKAFAAASESIARVPGMRGVYQRQAFYRHTLDACGKDVYFGWQTVFSKTGARIGDGVYLGRRCSLGLVEIGQETMLSDGVQILSGRRQHGTNRNKELPYKEQPQTFSRVSIGTNAWIGTNAVIMADVGNSTIVGAGAVVIEPIPEFALAAGVPAKVKRSSAAAGPRDSGLI
ncbi:MAG: acyltransferase [Thermoanaerobaculia bacterium]